MGVVVDTQLVRDREEQCIGHFDSLVVREFFDQHVGLRGVRAAEDGPRVRVDVPDLVLVAGVATKVRPVAVVDERDRAYFGGDARDQDKIGYIDANTRAIFGRSYAAEPDALIKELAADEAIATADTLLLTVPNTLGVDYNAHVIESILTHVASALGWR